MPGLPPFVGALDALKKYSPYGPIDETVEAPAFPMDEAIGREIDEPAIAEGRVVTQPPANPFAGKAAGMTGGGALTDWNFPSALAAVAKGSPAMPNPVAGGTPTPTLRFNDSETVTAPMPPDAMLRFNDYETVRPQPSRFANGGMLTDANFPAALAAVSGQPAPPMAPEDYEVQQGDSLWKIAQALTGNGANWQELFNAQNGGVAVPGHIHAGQKLRIPDAWRKK